MKKDLNAKAQRAAPWHPAIAALAHPCASRKGRKGLIMRIAIFWVEWRMNDMQRDQHRPTALVTFAFSASLRTLR
jgi:hypothetical protein